MACLICSTPAARAQSAAPALDLSQMVAPAPQFTAKLNVACGDLKKSSCALVLPNIATYATKQGLTLAPVSSLGSVQSAQSDVCPGTTEAAVGMADGFDAVRKTPACASAFDVIGHPLFPYFGYLIVANAVPVSTLDNLLNNLAPGQVLTVSSGKPGTGGQVTFANILASNPTYRHLIVTTSLPQADALNAVQSVTLHGYFVMDGPGSPTIQAIANATDAHGNPLYKFLAIDPGPGFYALKGVDGKPLYHAVTINAGFMGFGSTSTVSTDAVMIVNHGWAHNPANAQALGILQVAADQADAAIRAATHTPSDWTGDSTAGAAPDYVVLTQSAPSSQQLISQLKPVAAAPVAAPAVTLVATPAAAPLPAPVAAPPPALPSTNLDINFAIGSADLLPDDMAALDGLGQALSSPQLAGYHFSIVGHTDTVGDPYVNLALSKQRAETVKFYLESKYALADSRLQVEGVGEQDLLVNTPPNTPNQSNRRVEIINTGKSP